MNIVHFIIMSCISVMCLCCYGQQQPVAFPGAEGFGKYATGGRGGKVIIVSNLNDDGPGSLRDAIQKKYPRIIVFAVSGNIELASPLDINHGDVTIAGQSAPGDGICIKNYTVSVKADNVVIRFLRFRLGDQTKQEADALGGNKGKTNIIIDHCSMSWATDECASFYGNRNFTLQWCIISESLNRSVHKKGNHGYGGIWGGKGASFHHNLIASHTSRLPRFSGSSTTPNTAEELVDFRNNVIYNWVHNNAYGGERGRYNVVNNYYKPGPATQEAKHWFVNPSEPYGKFYLAGNYFYGNKVTTRKNETGVKVDNPNDTILTDAPFAVTPVLTHPAEEAYRLVLHKAGASLHRDAVDKRVTDEVAAGNSKSGKANNGIIDSQEDVGGWPPLKAAASLDDKDQDGMPDDWEIRKGLDPQDNGDATQKSLDTQYDNIEIYLNDLVNHIMVL